MPADFASTSTSSPYIRPSTFNNHRLPRSFLFGEHLFELALPGLQLAHGYGWRFDADARRVTHGTLDTLTDAARIAEAQLTLLA